MKKIITLVLLTLILVACSDNDSIMGPADDGMEFYKTASGNEFVIGLKEDNSVWGWGVNDYGILGREEYSIRTTETPLRINGLDNVSEIAAGTHHAIALTQNGLVYTWGANENGQLGVNDVYRYFPTPSLVNIKEKVKLIAAGADFNLAVTRSGKVYTWGSNAYNCQGHDLLLVCPTPVLSLIMANLEKIVINGYSCMAMDKDGNVWTWGNNTNNRLGREFEPFGGNVAKPAINQKYGNVKDIGFDSNFYVIDAKGIRTDIEEKEQPRL
jgi:alpha-tubulin suppressor-like RCC1 family protein